MQRTLARRPSETAAHTGAVAASCAARSGAAVAEAPRPLVNRAAGHDFRRLSRRAETAVVAPAAPDVATEESVAREPENAAAPAVAAPGSESAVEMGGGVNTGATAMPATVPLSYDVGGDTLADVAQNLPADEAGEAKFVISVTGTTGDPITSAQAQVDHSVQLPRWTELGKQCEPVKQAWNRFLSALSAHENGHIAISRSRLAAVHTKFIGSALPDLGTKIASETAATQAKYDAYDAANGHGLTGTPPTLLDTTIVCPLPVPPKTAAPDAGAPVAPKLDRRAARSSDTDVEGGADVSQVVGQGLSGGGQPLDSASRAFFEPRLGQDLSSIRVHTGAQASQSAEQVSARAYAVGNNIAFRDGEYSPGTSAGRHLLAHELAHTVQQGATTPLHNVSRRGEDERSVSEESCACPKMQRKMSVSQVGDPSEVEADRVADSVMRLDVPGTNRSGGGNAKTEQEAVDIGQGDLSLQRVPFLPPGGFPTPNTPATPPTAPAPPPPEDSTGLVYITIPEWTVTPRRDQTLQEFGWKTDVTLLKIPVPEAGSAFSLNFSASLGTSVKAFYGPVSLRNLRIGMTRMTALAIGGGAFLASRTMNPAALLLALKFGYMVGAGEIYAETGATAEIKADCGIDGVLGLVGSDKLDLVRTGFKVLGGINASLFGLASGRVEVILDNGHLTFNKAVVLDSRGALNAHLGARMEASALFGLFKGSLEKRWDKPLAKIEGKTLLGDAKLGYDWPGFKDEDKVVTVRQETVKAVSDFVQKLMEDDKAPSKIENKEKAPDSGPDKRDEEAKRKDADAAKDDAEKLLTATDATPESVQEQLPPIKHLYRLTVIELRQTPDEEYYIHLEINPVRDTAKRKLKANADDSSEGTRENPYELDWPKPASSAYQPLFFAGKRAARTSQETLRQKFENNEPYFNHPVVKYTPHDRKSLPDGGPVIGLTGRWFLAAGTIVGPLRDVGTPGGEALNSLLRPYGYRPDDEALDADHVHEIQFGGEDAVENLWPLNASVNRAGGPALAGATIVTKSGRLRRIADLKGKSRQYFFRVSSTR